MALSVIHRDDLPLGGFAGLKEHRLVVDPRVFGGNSNNLPGIGNFVYLADAQFNPKGETHMHNHKEIDVISIMVHGRITHEGSLEHGMNLEAFGVQVQRAGGEGFSHNEINPDDTKNRMIQLWVLPEKAGEPAGYRLYNPKPGIITRVYGGSAAQNDTVSSSTVIKVALLKEGGNVELKTPYLAYITKGRGLVEGVEVTDGDLFRGENLHFTSVDEVELILIHTL